jgi:hypothetical protein
MIEIGKKYKTVLGNNVVIHTVNGLDKDYPVIGEIISTSDGGDTTLSSWSDKGESKYYTSENIVEVKEKHKRTVWINIYPNCLCLHEHEANAKSQLSTDRIACVEVTFEYEEGQGL